LHRKPGYGPGGVGGQGTHATDAAPPAATVRLPRRHEVTPDAGGGRIVVSNTTANLERPTGQPPTRSWWQRWRRRLTIGVAVLVVLVVGGPFVFIHFIEGKAPAKLSVTSTKATGAAAGPAISADGSWKVGTGSTVGYRVKEVLFGQDTTAVGRTSKVTGTMTVAGTSVEKATFTTDMASVASDRSQRDGQFRGRIMDVSTYPTSTFVLTQPIALGSIPAAGAAKTYQAYGNLTLHGTTKAVTVALTTVRRGSTIQTSGQIPVLFSDYNITNPSFGPVTTQDHGILEILLTFVKS
jgi:polyisoprenoid-binding protein YceI